MEGSAEGWLCVRWPDSLLYLSNSEEAGYVPSLLSKDTSMGPVDMRQGGASFLGEARGGIC